MRLSPALQLSCHARCEYFGGKAFGGFCIAHLFIRPAGPSFPPAIFHFPFAIFPPGGGSNNLWAAVR